MNILEKYPKKDKRTASRVIDNEAVVVLTHTSVVHTLNDIGTRIWELCDGSKTVNDIIQALSGEFDADTDQIGNDTIEFLTELEKKEMIVL
ncbi:pyrroloquinoline quinone biosynthesis peptide chaperone PqqD [candidate division KSB1 bacterium]|nr:pyrroloquinoline quinone biosynthesis peptide chaperone PqqD [candidate division KSB1 bacterium]